MVGHTHKNREKIMRKRQRVVPNFLKMIRQFRQKYSHFEKIGGNFLSFSHDFLTIFVNARELFRLDISTKAYLWWLLYLCKVLGIKCAQFV